MTWNLRAARPTDVAALADLYAECARRLGPQVYDERQVQAWASFGQPSEAFARYVFDATTWVAEDSAGPAGFCGVQDSGEVKSLYVRHDLVRRGLGSLLLSHTLADAQGRGITHFAAWATPFSRPVFLRHGFTLAEVVRGEFEGTLFERYRMQRGGGGT